MSEIIRAHPALTLLVVSAALGSLPLIEWATFGLTGKRLSRMGTGNVSVSAAFYHGGTIAGVTAVLLEMFRGISVVLLARSLFPNESYWEVLALIPVVVGRYWCHRGAGVTNVVWGYVAHDWRIAFYVALIGGIGFTLIREKTKGRWFVLGLVPLITALVYPHAAEELGASVLLCLILALIYQAIPDDLDLSTDSVNPESKKMFSFFRGDRAFPNLNQSLAVDQVGQKAATLAELNRAGYPVPMGWVIPAGDDPEGLVQSLQFEPEKPYIVRSSAIGEDSDSASAAGQYISISNLTTPCGMRSAIVQCQQSYTGRTAVAYRRDRQLPDTAMAVLVQRQIKGVFSGVVFSRDPITRQGDAVVIEALPGGANKVVSGRHTPEQYRVFIPTDGVEFGRNDDQTAQWRIPEDQTFPMELVGKKEGETGEIPPRLLQHVAYLVRHIEDHYHGIPQDMEWSYDGHSLWVLQSRPITTLVPIWTRKIAAEVIPGFIRPLTWSINRPLTCGVWGEIFTLVLGEKAAAAFDFQQTATLHHSVAYFNASLLGQIFRQMGLPGESLEFLTRGAKFKRPSLSATLTQIPGLLRLLRREWSLVKDFERDRHHHFTPGLTQLAQQDLPGLSESELLSRIEKILTLLQTATYYSILAPLGAALRQAIAKPDPAALDQSQSPEVASLRAIRQLAEELSALIQSLDNAPSSDTLQQWEWDDLKNYLDSHPEGEAILTQLEELLHTYGYLSDVATDIAVPTWRDDPRPVQGLLLQSLKQSVNPSTPSVPTPVPPGRSAPRWLQRRVELKGQVSQDYSRLLAELRWTFLELERRWIRADVLLKPGDIFFLILDDIRQHIQTAATESEKTEAIEPLHQPNPQSIHQHLHQPLHQSIHQRQDQWQQDQTVAVPPYLVYGNEPVRAIAMPMPTFAQQQSYQGIGASPGQVTGPVMILTNLQNYATIPPGTIIVVPYTDAGWAPVLTQASGIIAEEGGSLSHGAIIAREYGIPAVMNVANSTQLFQSGQMVHLDGTTGRITVSNETLSP
ncbi:MAG: glycerol-3-phosphate acyltransferase [Leptolyngbyaceae cyanobacterium]